MPDITPGYTFASAEQNVTHTKLNNAAAGTINYSFLNGKSSAGADPNTAFELLLGDTSLSTLKKTTVGALLDHTSLLSGRSAKTAPVAADATLIADSAAGNAYKQMTVANLLYGAAAIGALAADDLIGIKDVSGGTVNRITIEELISLLSANTNPLPTASELMIREGSGVLRRVSLTRLISEATQLTVPVGTFSIPIYDGAYKRVVLNDLIHALTSKTTPGASDEVQIYDAGAGTIKKSSLSELRTYLLQSNLNQAKVTNSFALNPAGSWTDVTGMSTAITPRATTSLVLVRAVITADIDTNNAHFKIVRGVTDIGLGDTDSANRTECGGSMIASADYNQVVLEWLDSPATASAVTYKVQVLQSSGAVNINRTSSDSNSADTPRTVSTLTVQEVFQ